MQADEYSIRLYQRPDCPFCWKARIAVFESEVNLKEVVVELNKKHPDVVSLNPNATVPVLVDGDLVIYESTQIIDYLLDKFPETQLMPGSPKTRARIRQLHSYSDSKLGKILFPYIKEKRDSADHVASAELRESTQQAWFDAQSVLAEQLGEGDFFAGGFSVAECALIPRFCLAITHGLPIDGKFQNLKNWYARCAQRPSFVKALPQHFPGLA